MNTVAESIAQRTKICILNQGIFNAKKQHKAESQEENRRHNLDQGDSEVYIRLTRHEGLVKAGAIKAQIYNTHRRLTMPSPCDGMRVVPLGREFEHSDTIHRLQVDFDRNVQDFLVDYDGVIDKARSKFGPLFDPTMLPPKEIMKEKFYNHIRYMTCPTEGSWSQWLMEAAEMGKLELQDRIVTAARKLIETCSSDGKLYLTSALDNLSDICDLAGDLNLMEDPIIAKAAKELKPLATDFSAEILRDSKSLRRETSARAQQILTVLNLG